jgi:hypothetical protein
VLPYYRGFMITLRHITLGRTSLDEWSARRRELYLTTHNTHETDIHAPRGIRTRNPRKRAAANPHLRPRGHWDRPVHGNFFFQWHIGPKWARASSVSRLHDHTDTTLGRTALDEWSARRRDLRIHNTHKRETSTPSAGFEPTIVSSERQDTHA